MIPPDNDSDHGTPSATPNAWATLIEEAWQLVERGEIEHARRTHARAEQAAAGGADDPELVALAGALAAAEDDRESARRAFDRAAELDAGHGRYHLLAAEIELATFDDPVAAIERCDRALDITTDEDELIDGVLLKAEALIGLGDRDHEAREVLAELEGCVVDDPLLLCQVGDLHLTLGDLAAAERAYRETVGLVADWADGHYGLGLVYAARGDRDAQTRAWLTTRGLDLATQPVAWHLDSKRFEQVAERALAELPDEVTSRLANVPVFACEAPSEEQIADGVDPRLLGLFSGIPLPEKSSIVDGQSPQLDAIHLFQRNLERASVSHEHLEEEIRITVLHETAHFFGLEDDDLELIGLG